MELFEALHTRRSIRAFTDQPISEADLETILRAAMDAPSAVNAQPWHFVVITDRAMLDAIPDVHPHAAMCCTAQAAIVTVAELALEKSPGNWMVDCSAAVENLLLAARGLGIGSVWCGVYPRQERMVPMAALLRLPEGFLPHSLVPLGYPAQEFKRVERFKPERIHRNGW